MYRGHHQPLHRPQDAGGLAPCPGLSDEPQLCSPGPWSGAEAREGRGTELLAGGATHPIPGPVNIQRVNKGRCGDDRRSLEPGCVGYPAALFGCPPFSRLTPRYHALLSESLSLEGECDPMPSHQIMAHWKNIAQRIGSPSHSISLLVVLQAARARCM